MKWKNLRKELIFDFARRITFKGEAKWEVSFDKKDDINKFVRN